MPQRLWSRCMEFEKRTEAGKYETHYVDRMSGTTQKVLFDCITRRLYTDVSVSNACAKININIMINE